MIIKNILNGISNVTNKVVDFIKARRADQAQNPETLQALRQAEENELQKVELEDTIISGSEFTVDDEGNVIRDNPDSGNVLNSYNPKGPGSIIKPNNYVYSKPTNQVMQTMISLMEMMIKFLQQMMGQEQNDTPPEEPQVQPFDPGDLPMCHYSIPELD